MSRGERGERKQRLEALRRALREGKHVVDLDRLAAKLVDHELARRALVEALTRRERRPRHRHARPASAHDAHGPRARR